MLLLENFDPINSGTFADLFSVTGSIPLGGGDSIQLGSNDGNTSVSYPGGGVQIGTNPPVYGTQQTQQSQQMNGVVLILIAALILMLVMKH